MRKRDFLCIGILLLVTLFISNAYFKTGVPYTHDGENHLARFANYEIAIREHQFPPRFAPNFLNHYGYPVFNYNYPLANILSLPFSYLKIHYEDTFKIQAVVSIFLGALGIYIWSSSFTQRKSLRLLSSLVYLSTPYLISTIIYRGTIGEMMAFGFFPWLFISLEYIKRKAYLTSLSFPIFTIMWAAFFLAHNVSVILVAPVVAFFILFLYKKKILAYKHFFITIGIAVAISLWFWLPALMERDQIVLDRAGNNQLLFTHFPLLQQLLFSPVEFGYSFSGSVDSFSFSIGYLAIAILFLTIISIIRYKKNSFSNDEHKFIPWSILSILLFIFQLKITMPIWSLFPIMRFVQFPWRLGLLFSFTLIPVFIFIYQKSSKHIKILFIIVMLLQVSFLWSKKPIDTLHKERENYVAYGQTSTTQNENFPKTFKYLDVGDWAPTPVFLEGEGNSTVNRWAGSYRDYQLDVKTPSVIVEPTMYFLGWETLINGQKITYADSEKIAGRIGYTLEPGIYNVSSKFTEKTPMRIIGDVTSLIAICSLCIYTIYLVIRRTTLHE